ncbi:MULTISPECIES: hypothetical protein [Chryseobacterium]|uniref:Uncharacterized protein n=1 Tax=Chryseobacterium gambrini TaxID=373672 RepID=A0A1N7QBK0_9FLAO|nr:MULTISPECIES: hypothetical protein [Chryseobacterium]MCQ4139113.1 hypothetical protein [Chryseobacterium sp. EO14]SIT20156.1 hypothetical protein SAMN05421785_11071 [Chryseobacterium gambrini]
MIFAIYDFTPFKNELPEFNLKLLLNIEDLNNSIFNEVFNILSLEQQAQYISFKESDKSEKYRKERNAQLPYIDFNNLPETLDDILLEKIMLYQKDGEVRRAIYDSLSEDHKSQIALFNSKIYEEEKARKRDLMSEEEKRKEKEWWDNYNADSTPRFMGNMGEPANADEYVLRYGRNPFTGEPETVESFYKKYTITETGEIVPKENKE